jgi:hypothetical protein
MASIKKALLTQGLKLMTDRRVATLLQDERVMKALLQASSIPGKLQSFTSEQAERIAKILNLAKEDEVESLKRQLRRLEEELLRLSRERSER